MYENSNIEQLCTMYTEIRSSFGTARLAGTFDPSTVQSWEFIDGVLNGVTTLWSRLRAWRKKYDPFHALVFKTSSRRIGRLSHTFPFTWQQAWT